MVPPAGTEVQFIENPPSHIYLLWFSIFYTLLSFSLFLSHHDLCLNVKVWEPKPAWLEPFGSSSCGSSWCWNISFMFPFFCFSMAEHEVTGTFMTSPTENTPAHSDGSYQHSDFSEVIWGRSPFSVKWRLRSPETRTNEELTWNEEGEKLSRIYCSRITHTHLWVAEPCPPMDGGATPTDAMLEHRPKTGTRICNEA